jgi:subtilase family serine protease
MRKPSKLLTGFVLSVLLTLSAKAEDREFLSTQVPERAAQLPMLNRLPVTNHLELAIGLPFRDTNALYALLRQVYDRRSPNFHRYLTPEQFAQRFGPTEEDYQRVINYAKANGLAVTRTFGNHAVVGVDGQVCDIERMFHVHLGYYQHPTENRKFYGPDAPPSVEAGLKIINVSGLDNYFIPHPDSHLTPIDENKIHRRSKGPVPAGGTYTSVPNGGSFVNGTNALYGKTDYRMAYAYGSSLKGDGQVVGLYEQASYNSSDIYKYETNDDLPLVTLDNVVVESMALNGGNGECALDIEMVIAMAPGVRQVNVYEGNNTDLIMNEIASPTQGEPRPNQISSSWGINGDSIIEGDLAEMALQGQSYFTASGDYGAFIGPDTQSSQYFSSYMTYVGGTQLFMNGEGESWSNEIVWHDPPGTNFNFFASTGGILSDVPIPEYQGGLSMTLSQGSTKYRNFPDVAMVARDILSISTAVPTNGSPNVPGVVFITVGTSASSPLWAGFTALVNQQAAAQGLAPVGFLSPALYEIGQEQSYSTNFHDITSGNNSWFDSSDDTGSTNRYDAVPGYDLCTGWGTPAGQNLINALVGFAGPIIVDFNYTGSTQHGTLLYPFKTLGQGANAVSPGGTIFIIDGGSSSETLTISSPMTITAQNGAATVGQ